MNRRPFLWIAALALSGVAAGHSVAYYLAVPGAGPRRALLAQTGHSYWNVAVTVAVLLEVAGVFALAIRHFRAGRAGTSSLQLPFGRLAGRLAAMQVAAFTALEMTERLRSGVPMGEMFHNHLLPIGVAIQLVVACAGALLLRWLARAATAIGALSSRKPVERRPIAARRRPTLLDIPTCSILCERLRGRAPPLLLVPPR
jgi:hypothetical protein